MTNTTIIITILVTIDITGAVIYSIFDPIGANVFNEATYEEPYQLEEKSTIWNFIFSSIIHSILVITWLIGLSNILVLKKKGMRYNILMTDAKYLSQCIDTYLFSETKRLEEEELEEQIIRLEKLYNIYGLQKPWGERESPYIIQYSKEARSLFTKKIKVNHLTK